MTTAKEQPQKTQAQQDYEKGQEFMKGMEFAQAAAAFHNALLGYEQDGDESGVANAADKLGDICLTKGEYGKADAYFDRAYEICHRNFDRFSLFALEKKKAKLAVESGDLSRAIAAYIDLIDEFNALRDPQGAVNALETLADIYLKVPERAKAADCYRTIASIHKHYKHNGFSSRYLDKAAEIEAGQ